LDWAYTIFINEFLGIGTGCIGDELDEVREKERIYKPKELFHPECFVPELVMRLNSDGSGL